MFYNQTSNTMSLDFLKKALLNKNVQAFLTMIRKSEGTDAPDGYKYLFGSTPENTVRFTSFADHPNIKEKFRNGFSDAAGAYQIMYATWEQIKEKYSLSDFTPTSQAICAVELISERNVLQQLMDGNFPVALKGCANIWASLPGNNYKQPNHPNGLLQEWYTAAGGTIVNVA